MIKRVKLPCKAAPRHPTCQWRQMGDHWRLMRSGRPAADVLLDACSGLYLVEGLPIGHRLGGMWNLRRAKCEAVLLADAMAEADALADIITQRRAA